MHSWMKKSFLSLLLTFPWKSSFPRTVCLHLTWPNAGVEAEHSEVADDADYTLLRHPKDSPLD